MRYLVLLAALAACSSPSPSQTVVATNPTPPAPDHVVSTPASAPAGPWYFHGTLSADRTLIVFTKISSGLTPQSIYAPTENDEGNGGNPPNPGDVDLVTPWCNGALPPNNVICNVELVWTPGDNDYLIYPVVQITKAFNPDDGGLSAAYTAFDDDNGNNPLNIDAVPDYGLWAYTNPSEGSGSEAETNPMSFGFPMFLAPAASCSASATVNGQANTLTCNEGLRSWEFLNPNTDPVDFDIYVYAANDQATPFTSYLETGGGKYINACTGPCTSTPAAPCGSDSSGSDQSVTLPFQFSMIGAPSFYSDYADPNPTSVCWSEVYPTVSFAENCNGGLPNGFDSPYPFASNDDPTPILAPFWDVGGLATGNVCWTTAGTAPNRRFVIEWQGMNFAEAPGNSPASDLDLEVVLNEGSSQFSFVYETLNGGTGSQDRQTGNLSILGFQSGNVSYSRTGLCLSCSGSGCVQPSPDNCSTPGFGPSLTSGTKLTFIGHP
jgi:hypothetical protein